MEFTEDNDDTRYGQVSAYAIYRAVEGNQIHD